MKRGILLLIILLIAPFASASIYVDSSLAEKYNLGNSVQLNGYLVESVDTTGLLNILLSCGNETQQLGAKSINIISQESATFAFNLPITGSLTGGCKFLMILKDFNNNIIEQYETPGFEITKELVTNAGISASELQLGDKLTITGSTKTLDSREINGIAIIYVKKDGTNYLVDTLDVNDGLFSYETELASIPAGSYSVDIKTSDSSGNEKLSENALSFNLYDELILAAQFSRPTYLPGDVLSITGNVHKKTGPKAEDAKIDILFENQTYTSDVKSGEYSFTTVLDKKIKSYSHEVKLNVKDSKGNTGEHIINFEVTPVPTNLDVEFDKSGYIPEDAILINPHLYDQAHDIMQRYLKIRITDVDGSVVLDSAKQTTDTIEYKLPQFAKPGEWKLDLESGGLKLSKNIAVEEIELLSVDIVGQTLIIKNMGNELFEDNIDIDSDGVIKSQGVRLKPSEQASIELYKLFDDGTHVINALGKSFTVSIVDPRNIMEKGIDGLGSITGYHSAQKYGDLAGKGYLILLTIIFIALVSLILKFSVKKALSKKPDHIKRKYDDVFSPKIAVKQERKYDFKFGRADERDIADFRKRMTDKINAERRNQFMLPNERKKEEEEKGPFSMFK